MRPRSFCAGAPAAAAGGAAASSREARAYGRLIDRRMVLRALVARVLGPISHALRRREAHSRRRCQHLRGRGHRRTQARRH